MYKMSWLDISNEIQSIKIMHQTIKMVSQVRKKLESSLIKHFHPQPSSGSIPLSKVRDLDNSSYIPSSFYSADLVAYFYNREIIILFLAYALAFIHKQSILRYLISTCSSYALKVCCNFRADQRLFSFKPSRRYYSHFLDF